MKYKISSNLTYPNFAGDDLKKKKRKEENSDNVCQIIESSGRGKWKATEIRSV